MRKLILNAYNLWLLIEVKLHHTPESLSNINSDFCGTCDAQEMVSVLGLDGSSRDLTFDGMFLWIENHPNNEQTILLTELRFGEQVTHNAFDSNCYSTRIALYNSFIFFKLFKVIKDHFAIILTPASPK